MITEVIGGIKGRERERERERIIEQQGLVESWKRSSAQFLLLLQIWGVRIWENRCEKWWLVVGGGA